MIIFFWILYFTFNTILARECPRICGKATLDDDHRDEEKTCGDDSVKNQLQLWTIQLPITRHNYHIISEFFNVFVNLPTETRI